MWRHRYSKSYNEKWSQHLTQAFRDEFDALGEDYVKRQVGEDRWDTTKQPAGLAWLEEQRVAAAVRQRWYNAGSMIVAILSLIVAILALLPTVLPGSVASHPASLQPQSGVIS
jgi:hypothetical protein